VSDADERPKTLAQRFGVAAIVAVAVLLFADITMFGLSGSSQPTPSKTRLLDWARLRWDAARADQRGMTTETVVGVS
jgi:hypothetical protein